MSILPTTWSFSRWQAHQQCPLKYKLQFVDKAPFKQTPAMARGNNIHKHMAEYLVGRGPLPKEVVDGWQQDFYAAMRDHENKVVEQKWGFSDRWITTGWMAKHVWLRSILDVGVFYSDNTMEVVDHKTGKKYGDNSDQMELFALATMAKFHDQASRVKTRLVYIDACEEDEDMYEARDYQKLVDKWTARANAMLNDRQWLPKPNDKCKWCDFARSKGGQCRYA